MQFTKAEAYGLWGLMHLAEADRSQIVPLSEISETQDIPEKFLAKVFQALSRNGIIRSHRGVRGGFSLGRNPEEITLRQVVEAIQGPYHLMPCTEDKQACIMDPKKFCAIREVLILAEGQLLSVFEHITLAELARWQNSKVPPLTRTSV